MKPNFTLSLSLDGIRLLHRVADGWRLIGDVTLDSADLTAELAVLRKTATALEPGGLRSLLLIPDSQIRYLTIDTPGMDPAARRTAAAKALEGATPYDVSELVFAVSADGPRSHVAAVARETLDEAEAFAVEHRFHPVAFTAAPSNHPYVGAPDFGPTTAAHALLEPGEVVEPEAGPVAAMAAAPAPDGPIAHTDEPPQPIAEPVEQAETVPAPAVQKKAPAPDRTDSAQPPAAPPRADLADPAPFADSAGDRTPAQPAAQPSGTAHAAEKTQQPSSPGAKGTTPAGSVATSAAPLAAAAAVDAAKAPSRRVDFSAPPTQGAPVAGFASRRSTDARPTESGPSLGGASRAAPPLPDRKPASAQTATPAAPALSTPSLPVAAPSPAAAPLLPQIPVDAPAGLTEAADAVPPVAPVAPEAPQPDSSSLTPKSPASGATFLSRRKPKEKKPRKGRRLTPAALAGSTASSEAERMTIFGARRPDAVGGKPRFLGLMLTAALLVFLAGVAAWASIFLDNGTALSRLFGDRSPRGTLDAPAQEDLALAPQADTEALLPPAPQEPDAIETAALDAGLTDEDGAVLDALRDPDPAPITDLTEAEIDAKYAVTGIWPRAPEVPPAPAAAIDIEDLYLTSIDPISTTTDAVALPAVDRFATDTALGEVSTPVAAGTRFDLDTRGLVTPTAQGALSPDGHLVYLGRPAAVPPATLAKREVVPLDPVVDDALTEARPQPRPDDLSETTERAQLDGLTRYELAQIRPLLRPRSAQEDAAEALAAAAPSPPEPAITPIDTSDAVAAALATPPAIENATKFATTQSRRPDTRPQNFSRIVRRADTEPTPAPAQVASAAPRVVQPKYPSKTSVAQQATVKNAINLRKVNLIGVYGKPSNRRALVRLSNGRYEKVEIGDRIDGGRVAAISDNELRYVKRGQNVVLRMPN